MESSKRFDLLLALLASLRDKDPNLQLVLFGDGPERKTLEAKSEALSLNSNITFAGEVPLASHWLPAFDLFVFPSVDEGLPNVVMEAAAAGLPIVTWDLPFNREILENEKTGLLVEAGNVQKLEEALLRLISSPQLRSQLGREAQAHIQNQFCLEQYIHNMTAVYEDLLDSSAQSPAAKR